MAWVYREEIEVVLTRIQVSVVTIVLVTREMIEHVSCKHVQVVKYNNQLVQFSQIFTNFTSGDLEITGPSITYE